ncbi:hypothetical protein FBQ99_15705 [Chloroflexi bacterium CFX2]|nr:hypothetical protein [Chloroflexi bacterium CFX2]
MTTNIGSTTTYFVGAHYEVVETNTGTQVNKYYFSGAQRIAMRKDITLYYLLSDHLGSTSIVTDASGNVVSQTKYKAWGEVRYSSGSEVTKYQYTGQYSHQSEFGLLFYNARWYDPSLKRFAQADTIVPPGVQGLDRYAYGLNNPINFVDPSGHLPCTDDGYCGKLSDAAYQKHVYSNAIEDVYDWNLEGNWTLEELQTIYQTGRDIEAYVDGLTGGKGQEWMSYFLGNTTIVHGENTGQFSQTLPSINGNTIYLGKGWLNGSWTPNRLLAHELGHVWDLNTANRVSVAGAIGGVGDDLNSLIGGTVSESDGIHVWCRRCDVRSNGYNPLIPSSYQYAQYSYANKSTADYLAETFAFAIYPKFNPGGGSDVGQAGFWVRFFITFQSDHLP